jgi:hypothetical protein
MAQDHRQSQAQQLLDKQPVFEISLQLAPVAEHQEAQVVHFMHREARRVGVVQNIRAVLVVVIVRNLVAHFMQLRRPG